MVMVETLTPQADEQEKQVRYDLQTQFAELVDGAMLTGFELSFTGDDLIGEDGRSLDQTTIQGLEDIDLIIQVNPELEFERPRRQHERDEFEEVMSMAQGDGPNTKTVVSDYPAILEELNKELGGYNPVRKQTMLRLYTRGKSGEMHMYSRSLDLSDRVSLEAIYAYLGAKADPGELLGQRIDTEVAPDRLDALISELTKVYDDSLTAQYGGEWYAGRSPIDYRNTYEFVCRQQDIIEECLRLWRLGLLDKDTMYDMAATMNKRFKAEKAKNVVYDSRNASLEPEVLQTEVKLAGNEARILGLTFYACGNSFGPGGQFENGGFGNSETDDQYGSLIFECGYGHRNVRPRGVLLSNCQHCGISVKC